QGRGGDAAQLRGPREADGAAGRGVRPGRGGGGPTDGEEPGVSAAVPGGAEVPPAGGAGSSPPGPAPDGHRRAARGQGRAAGPSRPVRRRALRLRGVRGGLRADVEAPVQGEPGGTDGGETEIRAIATYVVRKRKGGAARSF